MRFIAVVPLVCAVAALILSLLCLFAGSSRGFLQNVDLLTLNTSMVGHTSLFNTSDGDGGFLSTFFNNIEGGINNLVNNATSDIARGIGIHDFYSAYILDYCEGYYVPNATVEPGHAKPHKNYTKCSNRTSFFHFNPTEIIELELKPGLNLSVIKWPDEIEDTAQEVEMAVRAMFVLYCIGIALTVIALVGSFVGFITSGRISALLNFMLSLLSFLALGLASALSTVAIVKMRNTVNKHGRAIGITVYKGDTFLGMTWAATGVMLLATFIWITQCFVPSRRRTTHVHEKETRI